MERNKKNDRKKSAVEEREFVDVKKAKSLLPKRKLIHVFSNPGANLLVGADWSRKEILNLFERAKTIEIGGEHCRQMKHGLVVFDGIQHWFIESDKII